MLKLNQVLSNELLVLSQSNYIRSNSNVQGTA